MRVQTLDGARLARRTVLSKPANFTQRKHCGVQIRVDIIMIVRVIILAMRCCAAATCTVTALTEALSTRCCTSLTWHLCPPALFFLPRMPDPAFAGRGRVVWQVHCGNNSLLLAAACRQLPAHARPCGAAVCWSRVHPARVSAKNCEEALPQHLDL